MLGIALLVWYELPQQRGRRHLFDPTTTKIATQYYDRVKEQQVTDIRFLEFPHDRYRIKNPWAEPASIQINDDKTLTFVESIPGRVTREESRRQKVNLLRYNTWRGTTMQSLNLFDPETPRLSELPASRYIFTDRDKGELIFVDTARFEKEIVKLPSTISSSFWTPDLATVLFTKDEDLSEGNTNVYAYDVATGNIQNFNSRETDFFRFRFSHGSIRCGPLDIAQQYWGGHGGRKFSPNAKLLAVDDCSGLALLNMETRMVEHIVQNADASVLGWINDKELLARLQNDAGDYRIVRVSVNTKEEQRLVPENFYWDIFWRLSPDRTKVVYAASSTSLQNFRAGNTFAPAGSPLWEAADLYIVDLAKNERKQLIGNYTPARDISVQWSSDSTDLLISADSSDYHAIPKCDVYNIAAEEIRMTIKPCRSASWIAKSS